MTEKTAKEYLNSISHYRSKALSKISQILELRAIAESCTVSPDKENVQTSGSGDKMASIVGRIVDLENEILAAYEIYNKRKNILTEITNEMGENRESQFLTYRYINNFGLYDTFFEMGVSDTTGKRIFRKSIAEFTKRYNEKQQKNHLD